jgi:hypothetical protein
METAWDLGGRRRGHETNVTVGAARRARLTSMPVLPLSEKKTREAQPWPGPLGPSSAAAASRAGSCAT